MLLCCHASKRLEPMGKVGGTLLYSPVLHGICYAVGHIKVQVLTFSNSLLQCLVDILGKSFPHGLVVEDHGSEIISNSFHSTASRWSMEISYYR